MLLARQSRQSKIQVGTVTKYFNSVEDPDPDPNPSDPYVFGPPGSGRFISKRYGCDLFLTFYL